MSGFLSRWLRRRPSDAEVREEMESHLAMRSELNEQDGISASDARQLARAQFGSPLRFREEARSVHWQAAFESLVRDLQLAIRNLIRYPEYSLAAIATLTVGLGATIAVYSVVDRVLFRPLPYPDESRILWFGMKAPVGGDNFALGPDYRDWKEGQTAFSVIGATSGGRPCDVTENDPINARCATIDNDFLVALGVSPVLGHNFREPADAPAIPDDVILSHEFFQSRYGGDPALVGSTISVDGRTHRVIGVLPRGFEMPNASLADILQPLRLHPSTESRAGRMTFLNVVGRLKPDIEIAQARARLEPLFEQSRALIPAPFRKEIVFQVRTIRDQQTQSTAPVSWVFLGAVFCLILLTGANVANLVISRTLSQSRERAIRDALGAGALRRLSLASAECGVLGLLSTVCGLAMGAVLVRIAAGLSPAGVARLQDAGIDLRVALFGTALGIGCAVCFGLLPSLVPSTIEDLVGHRIRGDRRRWLRPLLLLAQTAFAFILVAGAGMLAQSLARLEDQPIGVNASQLTVVEIVPGGERYQPAENAGLRDSVAEQLRALPGVEEVAVADSAPPMGSARAVVLGAIGVDGETITPTGPATGMAIDRSISENYFRVLNIPIVKGRPLLESDRNSADPGVVIDERLAARLLPGTDAIGRRLKFGTQGSWHTVVGVAANVMNAGPRQPSDPEFYRLIAEDAAGSRRQHIYFLRSPLPARVLAEAIRSRIHEVDAILPATIQPFAARVAAQSEAERFRAVVFGSFAAIALIVTACGLFGVVSFWVIQRRGELGVRMAFGATPARIQRMVLSTTFGWVIGGIVTGSALAVYLARYARSFLFETQPFDPAILGFAVLVLLATCILAGWIPARRAARLHPARILREE